ncbi:HAD domain-containing protein [Methylobacterium aquaticum]|uniref:HAD domain-containing protein n=1 Tax=Methylobacterium aquaticum TaxID=270351 RepID=UPI003D177D7C
MTDPVLFLDIDGVLNCLATWRRPKVGTHRLDPERIELLNRVIALTGCRICVSSTWRHGDWAGPRSCAAILTAHGVTDRFCQEWRTPDLRRERCRGDEIARWLSRNPVSAYAIVDDDGDMLPEQLPRFVQTTFEQGLTEAHAERLIALLAPQTHTPEQP